jgi:hypothetical protein
VAHSKAANHPLQTPAARSTHRQRQLRLKRRAEDLEQHGMVRLHTRGDELGKRVEDGQRRLMELHISALRCLKHKWQQLGPASRLVGHDADAKLTDHIRHLPSDRTIRLRLDAHK